MSSETLFSKIVTEATYHNPGASRAEILEGIFATLEGEILPAVLRGLSLPKFPSWSDIVIDSKRPKTVKRGPGEESFLAERRRVIQEIEYVRRKLRWNGDKTSTVHAYPEDSDNSAFPIRTRGSSFDGVQEPNGKEAKTPGVQEFGKTYPYILPPPKPKYQITFSERSQGKIVSNPLLERIFSRVEIDLRNLIASRQIQAHLEVSIKSDCEIASWEKTVITIRELPSDMTFEERMKIWEIFDLTIRGRINELRKGADTNADKYLKDLNNNLFVHVEL